MKRVVFGILVFAVMEGSVARAGNIFSSSSYIQSETSASGTPTSDYSYPASPMYQTGLIAISFSPPLTQQQPIISLNPFFAISTTTNGTATVAPALTDFTSFNLSASANTSNSNDGSVSTQAHSQTSYSGTFTLDSSYTYTLDLFGDTTLPLGTGIPGTLPETAKAMASLTGPGVSGNSIDAIGGSTSAQNFSGTLGPGTYTILASVLAESSGTGTFVDGANLSYDLELTPEPQNGDTVIPEPASLTLLGIGIAGMAGYGWRRRKLGI